MTYWFTADEHYGHRRIIEYCKRPFADVEVMNGVLIDRLNSVVAKGDIVVHAGDFTLGSHEFAESIMRQLNGSHIFLYGSHDYWIGGKRKTLWAKMIEQQYVVVCHYAMRTWPRSHYGSWQLYGHSHGNLLPIGKQYDIGVDNNDYYPVSFQRLRGKLHD